MSSAGWSEDDPCNSVCPRDSGGRTNSFPEHTTDRCYCAALHYHGTDWSLHNRPVRKPRVPRNDLSGSLRVHWARGMPEVPWKDHYRRIIRVVLSATSPTHIFCQLIKSFSSSSGLHYNKNNLWDRLSKNCRGYLEKEGFSANPRAQPKGLPSKNPEAFRFPLG